MPEFILLMHDDTLRFPDSAQWDAYIGVLHARGAFVGGSSIGGGVALRAGAAPAPLTAQLAGFIRVRAADLAAAQALVAGNPVYASGGTVEVRELPLD
jgi:YCII-related domain